jgi:hypothetical protein
MALRRYQIQMIADKTDEAHIRKALEKAMGAFEIDIRSQPMPDPSQNKWASDPRYQSAMKRRETILRFMDKRIISIPKLIAEGLKIKPHVVSHDLKYLLENRKIRKVRTGLYILADAEWPSDFEIEKARSLLLNAKDLRKERAADLRQEIMDIMADGMPRSVKDMSEALPDFAFSRIKVQAGYLVKKGMLARRLPGILQKPDAVGSKPEDLVAAFERSLPDTDRHKRASARRKNILKIFEEKPLRKTQEIVDLLDPADVPNSKADIAVMENIGQITRVDRGYYALAGREDEASATLKRIRAMSISPKLTEIIAAVDRLGPSTMRELREDAILSVTNDTLISLRLNKLLEQGLVKREGRGTPHHPYQWSLTKNGSRFLPR